MHQSGFVLAVAVDLTEADITVGVLGPRSANDIVHDSVAGTVLC